jgi:hypothetical protein
MVMLRLGEKSEEVSNGVLGRWQDNGVWPKKTGINVDALCVITEIAKHVFFPFLRPLPGLIGMVLWSVPGSYLFRGTGLQHKYAWLAFESQFLST